MATGWQQSSVLRHVSRGYGICQQYRAFSSAIGGLGDATFRHATYRYLLIGEMMMFPRGRYDDLTDTTSMALNYLRSVGEARTDVEVKADEIGTVMHKPRLRAIYPC